MGSRDRSPPKTSLATGTRPREPDKSSAQPDLCYSLELNHAMLVSSGQRITAPSCAWLLQRISTFTFMHLADAFIQSDLRCIQAIHIFVSTWMCSLGIKPTTFALLTQCSTPEPQEHFLVFCKILGVLGPCRCRLWLVYLGTLG